MYTKDCFACNNISKLIIITNPKFRSDIIEDKHIKREETITTSFAWRPD